MKVGYEQWMVCWNAISNILNFNMNPQYAAVNVLLNQITNVIYDFKHKFSIVANGFLLPSFIKHSQFIQPQDLNQDLESDS